MKAFIPSGPSKPGSVGEFFVLLRAVGLSPSAFMDSLSPMDLGVAGGLLQYLRVAALDGEPSPERLLFHLQFLRLFPSTKYPTLQKLLYQVRYTAQLSNDIEEFVEQESIEQILCEMLLHNLGFAQYSTPLQPELRVHKLAFLRSLIRFLESWQSLVANDPNLPLLFKIIGRYQSLQSYYASEELPRKSVQHMIELDYDVDYLVFGRQEIVSTGPSKLEQPESWAEKLLEIIRGVLGSREEEAEIDLGVDHNKLFYKIKDDFEKLKEKKDPEAAVRIIDEFLPKLEQRRGMLLRSSNLIADAKMNQFALEMQYIRKLLTSGDEELPAPQRLSAIRSPKLVPELLFDNARMACCLFKPSGLFHGEISRLLLDPATPLIEFWLDPYPEFLGIATLYPGLNAKRERTILMDTVEYDDRLLELQGNNGTMRFILRAIVIDAYLANAEKLLIFAGPYGKPVNFVNFVKQIEPRYESMTYYEQYYFESVDPANTALANSLAGRHHYTLALGYERPMRGVIDYGYALVGWGWVDKLLTGEKGVFEIDIKGFIEENHLSDQIPKKEPGVAIEADAAVHRLPPHHDKEIRRREKAIVDQGLQQLGKKLRQPSLELLNTFDDALLQELKKVEEQAFAAQLRYDEAEFKARLIQKEAEVVLLREGDEVVGFMLSYVSPTLFLEELYLDNFVLRPDYQSQGIGTVLLEMFTQLAIVRGYHGLYVLAQPGAESRRLVQFYQRSNFQLLGDYYHLGQLLYKKLGLLGPDNLKEIETVLQEMESRLRPTLVKPKVSVHTSLDPDLLRTIQSLEAVFSDEIRYSEAQFRERMTYQDAYILLVGEQNEPVAFSISYHDPTLPKHAMFLDSMSVKPEFQKSGIGTLIMEAILGIPTLSRYTTAVFYCQETNADGVNLVEYYKRFGAIVVDADDDKVRMMAHLSGPPSKAFTLYQSPSELPLAPEEKEFLQKAKMSQLPFVGEEEKSLAACGIHDVLEFLIQTRTPQGRAEVANISGVDEQRLRAAAHLVDMARIGIPFTYLTRLARASIETLDHLRNSSLAQLREVLPKRISNKRLLAWIEQAKQIESIVEE